MCPEFRVEFNALAMEVQDELLAQLHLLAYRGPALGRPRVDSLKGSRHSNMKELRFSVGDGVWRVACDGLRSPLIHRVVRCCWLPETRQASVSGGFTAA